MYCNPKRVRKITIVGGGVIGASWSALLLSLGYSVSISEPSSNQRKKLKNLIAQATRSIKLLDLPKPTIKPELSIHHNIKDALYNTDFVQECAPDKKDIKEKIFLQLDSLLDENIPIATSTSALLITPLQKPCVNPERFFTGHPYNPVCLMPLVEISGGEFTDPKVLDWAVSFYQEIGKFPVLLNKEISGHIAGRISAAIWQEAIHIVSEGIADVKTVDDAMMNGPGLRLATMGPHMIYHLAGGEGGMKQYIKHLGNSQESRWNSLGKPNLDKNTCDKIIDGVIRESNGKNISDLETERDIALAKILKSR